MGRTHGALLHALLAGAISLAPVLEGCTTSDGATQSGGPDGGGSGGGGSGGASSDAAPIVDVATTEPGEMNIRPDADGGNVTGACAQGTDGGGRALYVSPDGSDGNPGTQASPFATIQHAADVATPGTTVHVAPGAYTQCVATRISGTATARIVYVSDTRWGAQLNASAVSACSGAVWDVSADYVDVQGFDVTGGASVFLGIRTDGSHSRIIGNRVHDLATSGCNGGNGGAGIDNTNYSASDNDIIGNVVFNIGPASTCIGVHGIYQSQLGGHIVNNIASNNSGWGIHCWHGCTGVIVANNLTFNNRSGGMIFGDGDSGASVFDDSIVSNNIAVHNTGYGISEYEYSGQHTIGPNNEFLNNLVDGNSTGAVNLMEGNTDSGTMTADPQFIDYQADGSGDYRLRATSPAVDTGTSTGAPSSDFDGTCRPQGKGFDVGPYEQ